MEREEWLDFKDNFDRIPIIKAISNDALRLKLREFLGKWSDYSFFAWKDWYCPYMVTHGIPHIQNVFIFANRVYKDCEESLKQLNDADIFCMILSIWLHDIGLSKSLFCPDERELQTRLNPFLRRHGVEPLGRISEINCLWVREHHALITKYLVTERANILPIVRDLPDSVRDIIANICLYHSGKTRLITAEPEREGYNIPALSEITFPEFDYLGLKGEVKVEFIAALLRFLDGCDQTEHRIISSEMIEVQERQNISDQLRIYEKILSDLERMGLSQDLVERWKNVFEDQYTIKGKDVEAFIEKYREERGVDGDEVTRGVEEFRRISEQIEKHFIYKKSVRDVYFKNGRVVIVPSDPSAPDEASIEAVKREIGKELKECESVFERFSLPYTQANIDVERKLEITAPKAQKRKGKALLITVGTGVGPNKEKAIESLASGIAYSIRTYNPTKILFVVTEESERDTLPKVLEKTGLEEGDYEVKRLKDMVNIEKIYKESTVFLNGLINEGFNPRNIVVDYTSGTKAMSAGVAIAGALFEVETLSYINGEREGGLVIPGTERPLPIRPYKILIDNKLKTVRELFNAHQFDACIEIIGKLKKLTAESEIQAKLSDYENRCLAYASWDKFEHGEAYELLMGIKGEYGENKEFLGRLLHSEPKEPYYIADLMNNAERRFREGKYDDAVARLYRAMELIAQYKLVKDYGVMTSDVDLNKIPAHLHEEYKKLRDEKGKIKIGLFKDYELLKEKGDELGEKFFENRRLQNLLRSRNSSILAHGLEPVKKEVCEELFGIVNEFANSVVKNLDDLKTKSKFPRL